MITKPKQESLSKLIKELDTIFSRYIRIRDSDYNGLLTCFITGQRLHWTQADAAHFIPRKYMALRWHPMNVHGTTRETNRAESPYKHEAKYEIAMLRRYGAAAVVTLSAQKESLMKFTRPELEEMISDYKDKVKQLRKDKGL